MTKILQFCCIFLFLSMFDIRESYATESGSIIPLYIYPVNDKGENTWQKLFDAYQAHPIETWAIVNVNNGPGSRKDANYVNAIRSLHAAGIDTLGYVATNYTKRSRNSVQTDVNRWKNLYNTKGIFFDEMASDDNNAKVRYYQNINNHAKSQGFTFTVGNPGTKTSPKYFDTVDNIVVFESNTGFPSSDLICSQDTNGQGREGVSILPYNIQNLDVSAVTAAKTCAGYIYVTDDAGNNPWDTLPNYLTKLFEILQD